MNAAARQRFSLLVSRGIGNQLAQQLATSTVRSSGTAVFAVLTYGLTP
jgi:hypothetical protein